MRVPRSRPRRPALCNARKHFVRFRDRQDATRALANLRRSGRSELPVRVYRCADCFGWHLTSLPSVPPWAKQKETVGH